MPMQEHHDQFTLSLLRNDPEEFLLLCQPIIKICVRQYMASGMFPSAESKDIIQSVNERLFVRLESLAEKYSGRVLLKTYINVAIRNICLTIHEERINTIKTIRIHEEHGQYSIDPTDAIAVDEELERLHTVLQLFPSERHKIFIGMKLYLRIPLLPHDIERWSKPVRAAQKKMLLSVFGKNYNTMTMHEVFTAFAPVWHTVERNSTSARSIERWANENINTIVTLMNGNPPRRSHSKETLQVLLGEEYSRFINKENS
ncbi:MAG: sigma-70 family RNA polymerase sigma factor [Ignavibacteriales bacterium]|nr:sigma-70 family RNA polymerase sigma factor [Ignavibacteriales bacterium]